MTDSAEEEDVVWRGRKCPTSRRQRPTLYIPGFSDVDTYIEISQCSTPNGPLITGHEKSRRSKMHGRLKGVQSKVQDDVDSGVESSFSMLSIADDSNLHFPDTNRISLGLNTAQIPVFDLADVQAEDGAKGDMDNCSGETVSFLQEADELLEFSGANLNSIESASIDSIKDTCCHGNFSDICSSCQLPTSLPVPDLNARLDADELGISERDTEEVHEKRRRMQTNTCPIKKEILSLPLPFPSTNPLLKNNCEKVSLEQKQKCKGIEKSYVSASELLFNSPIASFTTYKSPSKYNPQVTLSPSKPSQIKVAGESRLCTATQTGEGAGTGTVEDFVQYLPALDGRLPGTPPKEKSSGTTYLSPVSIDSRTASEMWEDIVHNSERKLRDLPTSRGVYTNSAAQTENSHTLSSQAVENQTSKCANENSDQLCDTGMSDKFERLDIKGSGRKLVRRGENSVKSAENPDMNFVSEKTKENRIMTSRQAVAPHRRLFSELPVSSSNIRSDTPCLSRNHSPGPSTPVQDRKRLKYQVLTGPGGDACPPKGRAIRKNNCIKESSQGRNGKVRTIRPRKITAHDDTSIDKSVSFDDMDVGNSPCVKKTETLQSNGNSSIDSIDVILNIKTSTPVKNNEGCDEKPQLVNERSAFSKSRLKSTCTDKPVPAYFSPLLSSSSSDDSPTYENIPPRGRRIRPMKLSPAPSCNERVVSPTLSSSPPMPQSSPGFTLNLQTQIELSPPDLETITKIHTICNGQRLVEYINCADSPMVITHYPPPKTASKIQWSEELEHEVEESGDEVPRPQSPCTTPTPKPILTQRPQSFKFPFSDESPSPILLTKTRRQNILSQITQHTQL